MAGIVSYGSDNGVRSAEALRLTLATLQMAQIQRSVGLSLRDDFEKMKTFCPREHQSKAITKLFDQLLSWGEALHSVRAAQASKNSPDASVQPH